MAKSADEQLFEEFEGYQAIQHPDPKECYNKSRGQEVNRDFFLYSCFEEEQTYDALSPAWLRKSEEKRWPPLFPYLQEEVFDERDERVWVADVEVISVIDLLRNLCGWYQDRYPLLSGARTLDYSVLLEVAPEFVLMVKDLMKALRIRKVSLQDSPLPEASAAKANEVAVDDEIAGAAEQAVSDTETQDAETQDAETQDAGTQDAETQDAETQDAETQDAETQDAETYGVMLAEVLRSCFPVYAHLMIEYINWRGKSGGQKTVTFDLGDLPPVGRYLSILKRRSGTLSRQERSHRPGEGQRAGSGGDSGRQRRHAGEVSDQGRRSFFGHESKPTRTRRGAGGADDRESSEENAVREAMKALDFMTKNPEERDYQLPSGNGFVRRAQHRYIREQDGFISVSTGEGEHRAVKIQRTVAGRKPDLNP